MSGISILLVLGAACGYAYAIKLHIEADKYEFENRTSGGTVEFPSYADSVKHGMKKRAVRSLAMISTLLVIAAIVVWVFAPLGV